MAASKGSSEDPEESSFPEDEEQEILVPDAERISDHKNKLVKLRLGLIQTDYDEITITNLAGYQKDINDILEHVDSVQKDEEINACFQDIQKFLKALDDTKELLASMKTFKEALG